MVYIVKMILMLLSRHSETEIWTVEVLLRSLLWCQFSRKIDMPKSFCRLVSSSELTNGQKTKRWSSFRNKHFYRGSWERGILLLEIEGYVFRYHITHTLY